MFYCFQLFFFLLLFKDFIHASMVCSNLPPHSLLSNSSPITSATFFPNFMCCVFKSTEST